MGTTIKVGHPPKVCWILTKTPKEITRYGYSQDWWMHKWEPLSVRFVKVPERDGPARWKYVLHGFRSGKRVEVILGSTPTKKAANEQAKMWMKAHPCPIYEPLRFGKEILW